MLNLFRTNQFYGAIWLLIYFAVLTLWIWLVPAENTDVLTDDKLFNQSFAFLGGSRIAWQIIGLIIVFFTALYTNYIHNSWDLFERENYFTGAFYLIPASLFIPFLHFNPAMLATALLAATVFQLFHVYNEPLADKKIFNSGLYIGTAALFYTPFLGMIIWLYLVISILRPFKLREWLIAFFGLLAPFWIAFGVLYLTGELSMFLSYFQEIRLFPDSIFLSLSTVKLIVFSALGFFFLIAILNVFGILPKKVIKVRKFISSILLLIPFIIITSLLSNSLTITNFYPLILPFSLVAALYIDHISRNRLASFIHLTLVIMVIIGQYFNFEILKYIIP